MRGLVSIAIALGLCALAGWSFARGGFNLTALSFLAGGAVVFFRSYQGIGISSVADVTAPMNFVANPARAIVDCAADRIQDFIREDDRKPAAAAEFDPDSIIARYMESRPSPAEEAPSSVAPTTGFGRKGL